MEWIAWKEEWMEMQDGALVKWGWCKGFFCGGIEGGEGYGNIGIDRREMERANEKIDNEWKR